jgi:hypothetical protein
MRQKISMSQAFSMFQNNLEKVWDIEKCLYLHFLLHKISKKQGKNNIFQCFSEKNIEKVWDIENCPKLF